MENTLFYGDNPDSQQMQPDRFFMQKQIDRLQELTQRAQAGALTAEEEFERHALIEAELLASAQRSAALADVREERE